MQQQQRASATLFFASLLALTLLGCNGAERQRREQAAVAERQLSDLVSRCRGQQPAVQRQLQELERSSSELANLEQQSYAPPRKPTAPDPERLARFTREDQELELERYEQALAAWHTNNEFNKLSWQVDQEAKQQRSMSRQQKAKKALLALGVDGTAAARNAWNNCDGKQLAEVSLR